MFSKSATMVLAALVGLAGLHVVVAAPSQCPSGKADYCCGNPNPEAFSLSCHPYTDEATCTQSGGIHAICEHLDDGGMECTLPSTQ